MHLQHKNPNSGDGVTLDGTDKKGYIVHIQGGNSGANWVAFRIMSWHKALRLYNLLASDIDSFDAEFYMTVGEMMSQVDPSTLKKRECEEQVCALCAHKHTYHELWNYEFKEWDAACGWCEEEIVEHLNSEYFIKQEELW